MNTAVAMSFAPLNHRVMFLVDVHFDDGSFTTGESWANFPSWGWRERLATVTEGIAPLLIGRTFESTSQAHAHLNRALHGVGRQWGAVGPIQQAISAVDQAFWVRAAQKERLSLAALLSDNPSRTIRAYGSSLGPTNVVADAQRCLELGLQAAKVKVGFGTERDIENLRAVREVVGDSFTLFADANQAWSLDEALAMVSTLNDFGVTWLEEPLAGDDPYELAKLTHASGMPLATGENLYGASAFDPYLKAGSAHLLQPDVGKVGGVTDFLSVSTAAKSQNTLVVPHLYNGAVSTAITIQVAAADQRTPWIEWDIRQNEVRDPVSHLLSSDGFVTVPQGVGLGVDIDFETLNKFQVPKTLEQ